MCAMNPFMLFFYWPIKANKRGQKNKGKEMKNQVNKKLPSGITYRVSCHRLMLVLFIPTTKTLQDMLLGRIRRSDTNVA